MKTKIKVVIITVLILLVLILSVIFAIAILTPKADKINVDDITESFFIANGTYIDYQEKDECSAYSTAYVLRSLGMDVSGKEIYPKMKRFLGLMTVQSISKEIEKHGFKAQGYHGSINTLKQRIAQNKPVICYITNSNDTHYVVAVGYDNENIYLVDSIKENENVSNSDLYNRKVAVKEFEKLWKNKWYFYNNIYIVVDYK